MALFYNNIFNFFSAADFEEKCKLEDGATMKNIVFNEIKRNIYKKVLFHLFLTLAHNFL